MSDELLALRAMALEDQALRRALLDTQSDEDCLGAFCRIAGEHGISLTPFDIIGSGEEFSSNQTKSTNGGNPIPVDYFDDDYSVFMISIS